MLSSACFKIITSTSMPQHNRICLIFFYTTKTNINGLEYIFENVNKTKNITVHEQQHYKKFMHMMYQITHAKRIGHFLVENQQTLCDCCDWGSSLRVKSCLTHILQYNMYEYAEFLHCVGDF
jgi:hypothetical protein